MRIACRLQCQVTEKGKEPFTIPVYDAHHYVGQKNFKVEYRLAIVRIEFYQHNEGNSMEDKEILAKTDWFQKEVNMRAETVRNITFAGTTFSYLEKQDQIFIQRDHDII